VSLEAGTLEPGTLDGTGAAAIASFTRFQGDPAKQAKSNALREENFEIYRL